MTPGYKTELHVSISIGVPNQSQISALSGWNQNFDYINFVEDMLVLGSLIDFWFISPTS